MNSFVVKLDGKKSVDEIHRPAGGWPEHWFDSFHESDGGRICSVRGRKMDRRSTERKYWA